MEFGASLARRAPSCRFVCVLPAATIVASVRLSAQTGSSLVWQSRTFSPRELFTDCIQHVSKLDVLEVSQRTVIVGATPFFRPCTPRRVHSRALARRCPIDHDRCGAGPSEPHRLGWAGQYDSRHAGGLGNFKD